MICLFGLRAAGSAMMACLSIASPGAAADHSGARLAATCAACHRLDRQATVDPSLGIPPITGLEPEKLIIMMQGFRQNEQTDHIMHTVSRQLSDEEIAAVASYLANRGKAKQP